MEKNVLVRVRGLQVLENGEPMSTTEVMAGGQHFLRNGSHYLRYEETLEGVSHPVVNLVRIHEDSIDVHKRGAIETQMHFQPGAYYHTNYSTPMGTIALGIRTQEVTVQEEEGCLVATTSYALEMNGAYVADCLIKIEAQEKEQAGGRFFA